MARTAKKTGLEGSLLSLEQLVERMEEGDLTLEASLAEFEKGIKLIQSSQKLLSDAEQKVQILLENSKTAKASDFS